MVVSRAMAWAKGELLWMIFIFHPFARVLASLDGDALYSFKVNLDDPNGMLQSWNPQLVSPCTWAYVLCNSELKVTRVDLGNAALSGSLVPELGLLKNLEYLELYNNNITGKIPDEFGNLSSLVVMDIYLNHLSGPIPETLGKLTKLRFLRLNNNSLTGSIPESLTNIDGLKVLDLSSNNLSGEVPSTGSFSLFTPISFDNNPLLCGVVMLKHCPWSPPFSPPPPFVPPLSESSQGINHSKVALIASGVAVGALLLFALPIIAYAWLHQRWQRDDYSDLPAEDPPGQFVGKLKRFSLRELRIASDDFSSANILGRGAFGKVYKGRLADGSLVAIKRLKEERTSCGEAQFAREVEIFSLAAHKNLLRLHGFCMTPTERLLVYPFMVNGSVENCLRDRHPSTPPLDWRTRKNIALGSARGISYLHDHCDPKIIHRDIKAANILLNENFEPLVGDFGLARLMDYGDTHATTAAYGTIGHIAPEYLSTGRASEKADVFGFGITLLEIITGQRTFDLARLASEEDIILLDWVKKMLREGALRRLVDPALQDYDATDVEDLLQIALLCTQASATVRPEMSEVVSMLEGNEVVERWEEVPDIEAAWLETSTMPDSQYTSEGIVDSMCSLPAVELSGPR